jgi:hypothetical protein
VKRKETNVTEYISIVPLTWISLLSISNYFRNISYIGDSSLLNSRAPVDRFLLITYLWTVSSVLSLFNDLPVILSNALHIFHRNEVIPVI